MKKKLVLLVVLAGVLLSLNGCHKYEDIRITSAKVENLNLNGLRSADICLSVGVDNPAGKVIIKEAEGVVKHFGKVIGNVTLAPLTLEARTFGQYNVQAHVELAQGLGLMGVMSFASPEKIKECTLDVSLSGKVGGIAVKRKINDIPLKKLLESRKYEKI